MYCDIGRPKNMDFLQTLRNYHGAVSSISANYLRREPFYTTTSSFGASFFATAECRRRHTRFSGVTGVQTCALPICHRRSTKTPLQEIPTDSWVPCIHTSYYQKTASKWSLTTSGVLDGMSLAVRSGRPDRVGPAQPVHQELSLLLSRSRRQRPGHPGRDHELAAAANLSPIWLSISPSCSCCFVLAHWC